MNTILLLPTRQAYILTRYAAGLAGLEQRHVSGWSAREEVGRVEREQLVHDVGVEVALQDQDGQPGDETHSARRAPLPQVLRSAEAGEG